MNALLNFPFLIQYFLLRWLHFRSCSRCCCCCKGENRVMSSVQTSGACCGITFSPVPKSHAISTIQPKIPDTHFPPRRNSAVATTFPNIRSSAWCRSIKSPDDKRKVGISNRACKQITTWGENSSNCSSSLARYLTQYNTLLTASKPKFKPWRFSNLAPSFWPSSVSSAPTMTGGTQPTSSTNGPKWRY